jgi:hypothetical protein
LKVLCFTLLVLTFSSIVFPQTVEKNSIDFNSVDDALAALEANPKATLTEYEGWKVFNVKENGVYNLWSFTPAVHPAYPNVVKRSIFKKNGELFIDMDAICVSTQIFCDALMEDFKAINENIKQRESSY